MFLKAMDRFRDLGLLALRIGLGFMFIWHGWPKITGGPHFWHQIGMAMGNLGVHGMPVFWGFIAACAEFFGGIFLIAGFLTRPMCAIMAFDMFVATMMHFKLGQGLPVASHAIEDGIVFLSLILIGPGRFSVDQLFGGKSK